MLIAPVTPEQFFDRKDLLDKLEKRFKDFMDGYRRNFALLGPKYIGKTSLILKFLQGLLDQKQEFKQAVIPIYIEIDDVPLHDVAYKVVISVLNKLLVGRLFERSISGLEGILKELKAKKLALGKLLLEIIDAQRSGNYGIMFSKVLELPKLIYQDTSHRTILILDEFCRLSDYGIQGWIDKLRDEVMLQSTTLFVLISSQSDKAKFLLSGELSFLFGNFEIIELSNFSFSEAMNFLQQRLSSYQIAPGILELISYLTRGFPFYLDLIVREIRLLYPHNENIDFNKIVTIIDNLVIEDKGFLNRFFYTEFDRIISKNGKSNILPILLEVAQGAQRYSRLREILGKDKIKIEINGYLEKSGNFLKINDHLFRLWLKCYYQPQVTGIINGSYERVSLLRSEIEKISQSYALFSKIEEINKNVYQIISNFQGDFIEDQGKRRLLPKFQKVKLIKEESNFSFIEAIRENGKIWLFVTIKVSCDENLMYEIMGNLKGGISKYQERIIITVAGLSDTARIIAKLHKFWIWDLELIEELSLIYLMPDG